MYRVVVLGFIYFLLICLKSENIIQIKYHRVNNADFLRYDMNKYMYSSKKCFLKKKHTPL